MLREAPTRRDVVMHVYGIDIDTCERWQKLALRWKLGALVRSVRNREYHRTSEKHSLHYHNDFQFYMILDKETKVWHQYLLDRAKKQEKSVETHERIGRNMVAVDFFYIITAYVLMARF